MTLQQVVVASVVTVTLLAVLGDMLKSFVAAIPGRIWGYVVNKFTLSVTMGKNDEAFDWLKRWLAQHPYAKRSRKIKLAWSPREKKYVMVPGYGTHFLWHDGAPLLIVYDQVKDNNNQATWGWDRDPNEFFTVKMFSKDHQRLDKFLQGLQAFRKQEAFKLWVAQWRGNWAFPTVPARERPMATVYMDEGVRRRVIDDIQKFIDGEEWYVNRCIPYRRGYLFYGPPGTGKTTFATALASHFKRWIYCMNLNSVGSDESLAAAFATIPPNSIVLIEDVDAFGVGNRRTSVPAEESPSGVNVNPQTGEVSTLKAGQQLQQQKQNTGVTMSGLLNAVDGLIATEGRILIMTTNHVDKLDPALLRSGRIDVRVELGVLDDSAVVAMFKTFYPDSPEYVARVRQYATARVMTASNWQELFIRYHDSVDRLMRDVIDPRKET